MLNGLSSNGLQRLLEESIAQTSNHVKDFLKKQDYDLRERCIGVVVTSMLQGAPEPFHLPSVGFA